MIPPPIDTRFLLDSTQRRELLPLPPHARELAAWLLVVRDDISGRWEQRLLPCPRCAADGVPCMDSKLAGPGAACLNCYHAEVPCSASPVSGSGSGERVDRAEVRGSYDADLAQLALTQAPPTPRAGGAGTPSPLNNVPAVPHAHPTPPAPPAHGPNSPQAARRDLSTATYDPALVDAILFAARRTADPRVNLVLAGTLRTAAAPDDLSVRVLPSRRAGADDWLVLVHNQRGEGLVFYGENAAARALARAQGSSARPINIGTVRHAPLFGPAGGVHAAAIAVWLSRAWRKDIAYEFRIDERCARAEHTRILAGERPELEALRIERAVNSVNATLR